MSLGDIPYPYPYAYHYAYPCAYPYQLDEGVVGTELLIVSSSDLGQI